MTSSFSLVCFLCIAISSVVATSSWFGVWSYGSRRHSVWAHRGSHRPPQEDGYHDDRDHGYPSSGSYQPPGRKCPHGRRCKDGTSNAGNTSWERYRCYCLLKVEDKIVFRQKDPRGLYSCSRRNLYRCSQYCDELFEDSNLRARSRQEGCDVLNEEVNVPWYRRSQICGEEYYQDVPLSFNLCCSKGRPCY